MYGDAGNARLKGVLHPSITKCCTIAAGVKIMSFRNGDKSREHRLRKAKEKKRENVRKLVIKSDAKKQSPAATSVNK